MNNQTIKYKGVSILDLGNHTYALAFFPELLFHNLDALKVSIDRLTQ